jgi:tRNA A-37 threonylcarbamoyl transferase component Bud32
MYFVNWQRQIMFEERAGQKVVVKRAKFTTEFHEYVLIGTYVAISFLLGHPSRPPLIGSISTNEGAATREMLAKIGIATPTLLSLSEKELVEEYVEGGDLYRVLLATSGTGPRNNNNTLAHAAGAATGRLHNAGYVFTDNKAQNFLVRQGRLLRTDLGFLQKSTSTFARSMDVGSFLASVMDLASYKDLEAEFFKGYRSETGRNFPYLSIVLRNILSAGFASDSKIAARNMMADSSRLVGI